MKKRICVCFVAMLMATALIAVGSCAVSAHEAGEATTDAQTASDSLPEKRQPEAATPSVRLFFARVWEFVVMYKAEILGVAGDASILGLVAVIKLRLRKKTRKLDGELEAVKGGTSETLSRQASVIQAVNGMIDGYNDVLKAFERMQCAYEQYGKEEGARNQQVAAVARQNAAILEILTTVYANSRNLPQGVKDLVNLKYAKCLASIEGSSALLPPSAPKEGESCDDEKSDQGANH